MMRLLSFLSTILVLTSCQKEVGNCFKSTGPIVEEMRTLGPFTDLEVNDNINLTWHQSDSNYIRIKAGKNLISQITSKNEGKTLVLKNQNTCNWTRSYGDQVAIDLFAPTPFVMRHWGFGKLISNDSLMSSPLLVQHYGAGDISLKIKVEELFLDFNSPGLCMLNGLSDKGSYNIQGFGKLDARNLNMGNCQLKMEGENDAWIRVSGQLRGEHVSNRSVFVFGNPASVSVVQKASGKVVIQP